MLIDALIKRVNIPATSEVYMIKGEGELNIIDNDLMVNYQIEYNIPYDTEFKYETGSAILIDGIIDFCKVRTIHRSSWC